MAIAGSTLVVGAPDHNGERGAVYVFSMTDGGTTYSQEVKLTASDATTNDHFGCSVAIDGNTVVVGTTHKESVYVFRTSDGGVTYVEVARLTASDAAEDDRFGWSVAIKNNTVVVGAYYDDDSSTDDVIIDSGSAYIFRPQDGFTVVKALSGTTCGESNAVGNKVLVPSALAATRCCGSISNSFCNNDNDPCLNGAAPGYVTYEAAKATCEDAGARLCTPDELELSENEGGARGTGCGFDRAYVWSSEAGATYAQVARLTAGDAAPGDAFGYSVDGEGNAIVVGANGDQRDGAYTGSAYVFRTYDDGATYIEVARIRAVDAAGRRGLQSSSPRLAGGASSHGLRDTTGRRQLQSSSESSLTFTGRDHICVIMALVALSNATVPIQFTDRKAV